MDRSLNICVCCSGSVATLKIPEIVVKLNNFANVKVCCTNSALHFLERAHLYNLDIWLEFQNIGGTKLIVTEEDEWKAWNQKGDDVMHISIGKWADILLIAPASANLLGKAASGVCDNMVLSILRAWDLSKPCIICPAMNSKMYDHPITLENLRVLSSWGYVVINPIRKLLACQDYGTGALAEVSHIIKVVRQQSCLKQQQSCPTPNCPTSLRNIANNKNSVKVSIILLFALVATIKFKFNFFVYIHGILFSIGFMKNDFCCLLQFDTTLNICKQEYQFDHNKHISCFSLDK